LVPGSTLVGDRVIIIPGFRNPFVTREDKETYKLIGDCYAQEYDSVGFSQLNRGSAL
jgi:hypothetical protein